jgi:hypothetical protein
MVFFSLRGWQTEPVFSFYTHGPCLKGPDTKKLCLLMAASRRVNASKRAPGTTAARIWHQTDFRL